MADMIMFSTYIYGIFVKFADVVTNDTSLIINNNVAWMFSSYTELILAHDAMFGFRRLWSYMLPHPLHRLDW